MKQDRREFLGTLLGGAGWAMFGGCATLKSGQEAVANRPVRRDISSLAPDHPIIVAYKSAITQMKALPSSDPRNWTRQMRIHQNFCPHANWLFLPWHRVYLLYFERICRKLSGMADFALPYWNWSTAPSVPAPFWGGSSNPLFNDTRIATATSIASPANVGPAVLTSILNEPNFLTFASGTIPGRRPQQAPATYGRLEGTPHNYIHGFVGGNMRTFLSPLDPIFWLHHNMIERCWVQWNFDNNFPNTNDSAWLNREFTEFCDEEGNPVRVSVSATLLFPVFLYRYDDVGPGAARAETELPETKAMQDQSERKAKAGAKLRLDVVRTFAATQPLTVAIDRPASVRIAVDPQVMRALNAPQVMGASNAGGDRLLFVFEGVSLDDTEDFSVHVFVNMPDASVDTPPADPHFAGAFACFEHPGADHDRTDGSFVLDAGEVFKRLNIDGGTIELNIVLVPYPGRQPRTRELKIASTELRIAKDVIERSP
jgi:tyrosinase